MTKTLLKSSLLAAALCGSSMAMAEQIYFDNQINYGGSGSETTYVDELQIRYSSQTTFYDTNPAGVIGDTFQSVLGSSPVTDITLLPVSSISNGNYDNDFPDSWALSFELTNVGGYIGVQNGTPVPVYTAGTIAISYTYLDNTNTVQSTNLIDLAITGSSTVLGNVNLFGEVDTIYTTEIGGVDMSQILNFIAGDISFYDYMTNGTLGDITDDQTIAWVMDQNAANPGFLAQFQNLLLTGDSAYVNGEYEMAQVEHTAFVEFNKVPEPAPLALLGLGLLGLAARKHFKKA